MSDSFHTIGHFFYIFIDLYVIKIIQCTILKLAMCRLSFLY